MNKIDREIIEQYISGEISPEEAIELIILVNKSCDSKIYARGKRQLAICKHFLLDKNTVLVAAWLISLIVLFMVHRIFGGQVNDLLLAIRICRIMMLLDGVLIICSFGLCLAHQVFLLHRMGIRIFSLDFFRLDSSDETDK